LQLASTQARVGFLLVASDVCLEMLAGARLR
jgi:hypothetical protein